MPRRTTIAIALSALALGAAGAERRYDLRVQRVVKNVTGVDADHALAVNGTIPAPTLRFRLGDVAVINVANELDVPTTLHWHGVLVPWQQDGPQFSNSRIIEPGRAHTFRFPIRHTGTYWYHSHTNLQEQSGLYGAIVIEDERPRPEADVQHDLTVVMSDWTNERPETVLANLKKNGHIYAWKKGFLPSIADAIAEGNLGGLVGNEWSRMGAMDLGDVGYDAFLINGEERSSFRALNPGERVRLRVINASASTYFHFNVGDLREFTVISKDGMDVQPVKANEILVGVAETYDVVFEAPLETAAFEARATAQDATGHASLFLGRGPVEAAPDKERPSPNAGMDHSAHEARGGRGGHGAHGGHEAHGAHEAHGGHGEHGGRGGRVRRADYAMLRSVTPTDFRENLIRARAVTLELAGDMERFTWNINGKPFSEDKYIHIRENEVITFRLVNTTMMHHPMHLHGHFFRVPMGQGRFAPLFHTVDVGPMGTVTMEFHANEPGIWFLHCHNLYHMKMGMARLVKYEGVEPTPGLLEDQRKWGSAIISDDDAFWRGEGGLFSNTADLRLGARAGRLEAGLSLEVDDYEWDTHEVEAGLARFFGRFLSLGGGGVLEDGRVYGALMAAYVLPGHVEAEALVRHDGGAEVAIGRALPLTRTLELDLGPKAEFGDEGTVWVFETELRLRLRRGLALGANFKKESGRDASLGAGLRASF